jgi:GDPmannose 4,6-dehydratase
MLQQERPDVYVLATGETHTVRSFVERAFARVGIEIAWRGAGVTETGHDAASGATLVEIDPRYFRPTEVDLLVGDPSKAQRTLGWRHEMDIDALVAEMVDQDMAREATRRKMLEI